MLKYFSLTIVALVVAAGAYFYVTGTTKIEIGINVGSTEYMAKDELRFEATIKNIGKQPGYFFIDVKSDIGKFTPHLLYLAGNTEQPVSYTHAIPPQITPGKYAVDITVKTRAAIPFMKTQKVKTSAAKTFFVEIKQPPPPVVRIPKPKPPEPLMMGNIKFVSLPQQMIYHSLYNVRLLTENISSRRGDFVVWLIITGPENTLKVYSQTVTMAALESREIEFVTGAKPSDPPGEYFASAEMRELPADRLLSSDAAVTTLTDMPPKIEFKKMDVSKTRDITILCDITDDVRVETAKLFYEDPLRNWTTTYNMDIVSGTRTSGAWSCSFRPYKKAKNFSFYLKATDSKNNTYQTNKNSVSVVKK